MADTISQTGRTFAQTYEGLLPGCLCFQVEGEDISDGAQHMLGGASDMGGQLAAHILAMNVCPAALPLVLSVVVSSVIVDVTGHWQMRSDEPVPATISESVPLLRERLMALAEMLGREADRMEREARLWDAQKRGAQGSC